MKKKPIYQLFADAIAQGNFYEISYREHEGQKNISVRFGKQFYLYINEDDTCHLHISGGTFPIQYEEMVRWLNANGGSIKGNAIRDEQEEVRRGGSLRYKIRHWWQGVKDALKALYF